MTLDFRQLLYLDTFYMHSSAKTYYLIKKKILNVCYNSEREKMFHQKKSYSLAELNPSTKSSAQSLDSSILKSCNNISSSIICNSKISEKRNPFLGFFYTFLTSVLFTLTYVFVKKLSSIDPGQLSFVRNVGAFAGCLPITIYSVRDVFGSKEDRCLLLFGGFLGATAMFLNLTSYRYLPLAEASVVMSAVPALSTVFACFYLKEPCGRVQVLGLVTTICGVLLSVRLPELFNGKGETDFDGAHLKGLFCSVACVILFSVAYVAMRKMKHIHFSVQLIYYGFLGTVENGVISFSVSPLVYPSCGWDQIVVLLIGILGFMGNCSIALAVQKETVGIVSVVRASLDIVVAMILQTIFFNDDIDKYNIIGACLVILSVCIIGLNKWLRMLPEDSEVKKRYKYFL